MFICGEFEDFRCELEKPGPGDGSIAQVLLGSTGTSLLKRGSLTERRPSRDSGSLPRKEREAEFSEERGI